MNAPWEVIGNWWPEADHIQKQDKLSGQTCDEMRCHRHADLPGRPEERRLSPSQGGAAAAGARRRSSWCTGPKPPPYAVNFGQGPCQLSFIHQ